MTSTNVYFNGIATADCSKMCVQALSNTFPQSPKHDGTASEQRLDRHRSLSVLRVRQSQCLGEVEGLGFSGYIWKNRKKNYNLGGIHMNSNLMSDDQRDVRAILSLQPDHFGCALPLFIYIFTEAAENASCNLKGIQQLLVKTLFD